MTMHNARRALSGAVLCAGLVALAGCGEDAEVSGLASVGKAAVDAAQSAVGLKKPAGVTTSDAELRAFPTPLLKITQLDRGLDAVVGRISERPSGVVWQSADMNTLTLRDGMLVATRGFGDDMMSSEEPKVRGGAGNVLHDYYFIGGDEQTRRTRFRCTLTNGGSQNISVVGVTYNTRLIVEDCNGDDDSFQNRYWIGNDGVMRRSQQWAGETTGSLLIEVVPFNPNNRRSEPAAAGPVGQTRSSDGSTVVITGG